MIRFEGLFKAFMPLFVLGLIFTSCQKEEITSSGNSNDTISFNTAGVENNAEGNEKECFSFVYPITLNFPDGTTSNVTSDEELKTALTNWYDTQGENAEDPTLTFPITVILAKDGMEKVLNTEEELELLEDDCYGEDFDDMDCFTLKYPFSVNLSDGTTLTFNNDMEVEEAKKANPDVDFELVFPVTVIFPDGTEEMISTEEDFELLEDLCDEEFEMEDLEDFEDCFEVVFPLSFTLADGSMITINNEDELEEAFEQYEEEEVELVFPITFILEDGIEKVVNNENELIELLEYCEEECDDHDDYDDYEDYDDCIELIFPLKLVSDDGTEVTVNSYKELEKLEEEADKSDVDLDLAFPLQVKLISDGSTVTVNDEDELEDLEDSCE